MVIKSKVERMQDEIISKAGSVVADLEKDRWVVVSLRLTKKLIEQIEEDKKDRIGISRNAWILEAIQEKIKRTTNQGKEDG